MKEALPKLVEAVSLEPDAFDLRLKLASLNHRLEKYDDAETQLAAAARLAEKEEEKDAILDARVKNDQAANRLAQRIEALNKELAATPQSTAPAWIVLARYLEADAKLPEAVRAADKAVEIDPRSIGAWTLAARLRESAGSLADAAEALRRLAEIDRRNRIEHLTAIARLESRLGRVEPALKAGRDLLAAAPGNPENYEFFRSALLRPGPARGRSRRPAAGSREPGRERRRAPARRDPGRPVSNRRSHRDVLARLQPRRRPRSQARSRPQAHRALPPAQPARPALRRAWSIKTATIAARAKKHAAATWPCASSQAHASSGDLGTALRRASRSCWPPIPAIRGCSSSSPSSPKKRATRKRPLAIRK